MPIFPAFGFFEKKYESIDDLNNCFNNKTTMQHASPLIFRYLSEITVPSDRVSRAIVNNNRLRHTALTRGAEDGLDVAEIARITGVTVPAARHYIDIDYDARVLIDQLYIGNKFLESSFNTPVSEISKESEVLLGPNFTPVGGVIDKRSCEQCSARTGRPIGCYGCPSFRPILEANHRDVLAKAKAKLEVNKRQPGAEIHKYTVSHLERQVQRIEFTISLCDEIKGASSSLNDE